MGVPVEGASAGRWSAPPDWFESYFRERYRDLLGLALSIGGARHLPEAEDAVQSVMVAQVEAGCWEHIENPQRYFSKAVIRAVLMIHRSRNGHPEASLGPVSDNASWAVAGSELTVWEDTEWVIDLLNELPREQRKVMALTLDGLTRVEIAELLGASEGTVRSNLRHARDRLGKLLTEPDPGWAGELRRGKEELR